MDHKVLEKQNILKISNLENTGSKDLKIKNVYPCKTDKNELRIVKNRSLDSQRMKRKKSFYKKKSKNKNKKTNS